MAKKYLKNEKGIVRAVASDNLQLEKPLVNENYDINVHNRNMDKIDSAIQEVKGKIDGLDLIASKVTMIDGSTVEDSIKSNKTSILNNTDLANQALAKANEAFQCGDNVKTQLVDKLISEGLDVSTNNTFEELINNIALGKKWANGETSVTTGSSSSTSINGTSAYKGYLTLNNLGFKPSIVIVRSKDGKVSSAYMSSEIHSNLTYNAQYLTKSGFGDNAYNIGDSSFLGTGTSVTETKVKILAYVSSSASYKMSGLVWYAFE